VITGVHAVIYSKKADAVRRFFKDTLKLRSVDAGDGWLIFALPPAELGIHPGKATDGHELYLLCDDVDATIAELKRKRVRVTAPAKNVGWGKLTYVKLPDGATIGLYEPLHASPLKRAARRRRAPR
jgi:predicted enzyme related to lactoylglutathione lyase